MSLSDLCSISSLASPSNQAILLPVSASSLEAEGVRCNDLRGVVQDWLEAGKLGKALLRRYDDPSEACRELAISTMTGLMQVGRRRRITHFWCCHVN